MQRLQQYELASQLLRVWVTLLLLLLPSLLIIKICSPWEIPAGWSQNLPAINDIQPHLISLDVPISAVGTWLGFGAGALWLNPNKSFRPKGNLGSRITQYPMGMAIALIIWAGLDYLFPEGHTLIAYSLRYLRYALLGGWIAAGAPLIFLRMRHRG